jgi:soluble cytochrome b562
MKRLMLAVVLVGAAACGPPKKNTPVEEIPKLTKLDDVMDVQSTVADPQFKKIGAASYSDADFAAFADAGARLQASAIKIKDFSKGAGFDALAAQLHDQAKALADAAAAKNAAAASQALTTMKATCKECHSKYR